MKTIRYLPLIAALIFAGLLNGCILDALDQLVQNFPFSAVINVSGTQSDMTSTTTFYIPYSSKTMSDYADKLKKLEFGGYATFRDSLVSPNDLQGNVTLELSINSKKVYSQDLGLIRPASYKLTPYKLTFTPEQIQTINNELANFKTTGVRCTASITTKNVTPAQGQKNIIGVIDLVFTGTID